MAVADGLRSRANGGVRRIAYFWRRLMRLHATPHEIALGCAAGVFAAFTPFLGFQMLLAGSIAFLLRVNVPAALLGTFAGNPLSWPAIWAASYVAGAWTLGYDPADRRRSGERKRRRSGRSCCRSQSRGPRCRGAHPGAVF